MGAGGHELGTRRLWDLPAAPGHATSWSLHLKRTLQCLAGASAGQSPQSWTRYTRVGEEEENQCHLSQLNMVNNHLAEQSEETFREQST